MDKMELKEAIEIIREKFPTAKGNEVSQALNQMAEIIKEKTANFTDAKGINTAPIDMKAILQKLEIKPADWRKSQRSFQRSEADSVIWLANYLTGNVQKETKTDNDSSNDLSLEELEIIELEALAYAYELELYKYKKAKNKKKK